MNAPSRGVLDIAARVPMRSGYARADDGVELFWRAIGTGPVIACCNGVGVSTFFWKYLVRAFSDRYQVVLWDYRGHGRSERRLDPADVDMSIARHADDLRAVLDDVGGQMPATVVGHSMGCQVALEFRRRHPDHVAAIVMLLGTAGRALETFYDYPGSLAIFERVHKVVMALGGHAARISRPLLESPLAWPFARKLKLVDPFYTREEDLRAYVQHLATLDLRLFVQAALQCQDHDAWDLLPELDRPLLVVAAEKDTFTPLWCSRRIAELTPGAELFVLADATHAALVEQPETINHRVERFLRERVAPPRP